jgi:hypothetical protein
MTVMSSAAAIPAAAASAWPWPLDLNCYRRQAGLTGTELDGLRALGLDLLRGADRDLSSAPGRWVHRLVKPLDDAQAAVRWHPDNRHQRRFVWEAAVLILTRCAHLRQSFWRGRRRTGPT